MRGPEDFKHLSRSSFLFIQKELEVLQVPSPALGAKDKEKIIR